MKITKGKLKQIIAEEHALVYGKRPRPQGRRKTTKKQRMNEAKRELIYEIQVRAITNELMTEGMLNELFGLGKMARFAKAAFSTAQEVAGEAGAAAIKKVNDAGQAVASKAADMKTAADDYIQGLKKSGEEKVADVLQKFAKNKADDLKKTVGDLTKELVDALKKAGLDDDEVKANVAAVMPSIMGTCVSEAIVGPDAQRLNEAKSRKRFDAEKNRRLRTARRR